MYVSTQEKRIEALNRLEELCKTYNMNDILVAKLQNNEVYVSYDMGVKSMYSDDRYVRIVKKFEEDNSAVVYHVIESKTPEEIITLSILFVSDLKNSWESEKIQPDNKVKAFVSTVDDNMGGGFGNDIVPIKLYLNNGHLTRLA